MRHTILPFLAAVSIFSGIALTAKPAHAQYSSGCLAECDEDFPPNDIYLTAVRGWCYILRCSFE